MADFSPKFHPGQPVTGAPGRVSEGWTGTVKEVVSPKKVNPPPNKSGESRPSYTTPGGYRVWWKERAEHEDKAVAKEPVLFMLEEQLRAVESPAGLSHFERVD